MQTVATSKDSVAAAVLALVLVEAITLLFVWLPFLLYLLMPERTGRVLGSFNAWLRSHGHQILVGALLLGRPRRHHRRHPRPHLARPCWQQLCSPDVLARQLRRLRSSAPGDVSAVRRGHARPVTVSAPAEPTQASAHSPFPPIADYAFLSDCTTTALIAPDGAVEWMCLPQSRLGRGVRHAAGPVGRLLPVRSGALRVPANRRYLPGSMVLETTWSTATGWLVVTDALVMGKWRGKTDRGPAAAANAACGMLVRTATCITGRMSWLLHAVRLRPVAGPGYRARLRQACPCGQPELTCTACGLVTAARERPRAVARGVRVRALSWQPVGVSTVEEAQAETETTVRAWRDWLRHSSPRMPDHPWRPYIERSALTLKGLSYAPSGAIMAAATTSLPETPGGERNWDYRFTWVRDSAFMLSALYQLGYDWEAFGYFAFLMDAVSAGPLQIMYGIDAERELDEQLLDHLHGYDGARPVRVGNGAYNQRQHDVWGMAMAASALYFENAAAEIGPRRLEGHRPAGRERAEGLAGAGSRHLGDTRRSAALHRVQGDVLGGRRPRSEAGRVQG